MFFFFSSFIFISLFFFYFYFFFVLFSFLFFFFLYFLFFRVELSDGESYYQGIYLFNDTVTQFLDENDNFLIPLLSIVEIYNIISGSVKDRRYGEGERKERENR